ncbi:hypothetical protein SUGI_0332660 [Cryptomeria japonica]|uniref:pre-rRNA-processing protein SRD1 n=1 Tax=Cryptomeria japonica TaxID=3369 RepID=UPI002408DEF1|nr:pre-rRNA-processing protein SRD1 [Cryptomeria japonica]GLJ18652.1 hypothetical protein SUGI_0332660 [Cryptomeria japonica]
MDFWENEEIELGLKLCYSPVKRKRRSSCSQDLFNGSSSETVSGIYESLGNSNNSSFVSDDPEGKSKEKNLIRCLMKSYSSSNSKYNSLVSFNTDVDCTLSLGMPHIRPSPEEQRVMDMYKASSMEEVKEIMMSALVSSKITSPELEASGVPLGESSSCWSTATNTTTTSTPISWFPTAHSGSKLKDILAHGNYATRPKKNSNIDDNITADEAARCCSACHTTATPLWRSGPKGAKSLCNACGIRYKKEDRRSASAMAVAADNNNQFAMASCFNSIQDHNNKTAAPYPKPSKKIKLLHATFEGMN